MREGSERAMAVARGVAEADPMTIDAHEDGCCFYCRVDEFSPHDNGCLWTQARALLAAGEQAQGEA